MGHLLGAIDQARLDEQRGVVQNEKRQGENQPYGQVVQPDHRRIPSPRAIPTPGPSSAPMEDLNAASLEDVKEWFKTYYGAANAVLVVAGDVDRARGEEEGREVLRRHSRRAAGLAATRPGSPSAPASTARRCRTACRRPGSTRSGTSPQLGADDDTRLDLPGRRPRLRQDLPPLQAPGLRRPDRHRRQRLPVVARDRRPVRDRAPPPSRAATSPRSRRPSTRSWPGSSTQAAHRGGARARPGAGPRAASSAGSSASAASAASPTSWRRARSSWAAPTPTRRR